MGTQLLIEVLSADAIEELIINLTLEGLYVVQPPYQWLYLIMETHLVVH